MEIIVRLFGEIALKSPPVRSQFQKELRKNINAAFCAHRIKYTLQHRFGRLIIGIQEADIKAIEILQKIFGIHNISPVELTCEPTLEKIKEEGKKAFAERVRGKSFAIRARRSGAINCSFTSMDIGRELGSLLNEEEGAWVDLKNPEVIINLEVDKDKARFYEKVFLGPGGLPLRTAGKAVCLFSGGFDSPLAAWMSQKRGIELVYVFCNMAGKAYEKNVLKAAKVISDQWSYGTSPKFITIDFLPVVEELKKKVEPRFLQVILKRFFYRIAETIAEQEKADVIITGECVGQVSSQTLSNLRAIEDACSRPVLRPLIAFNKIEIIDECRRIGTYTISASMVEHCQLVPKRPATSCPVEVARHQESLCDLSVLDSAYEKREEKLLHRLTDYDLSIPYLFTEEIPENAVLIDCRTQSEFEREHKKNAIHMEFLGDFAPYLILDKKKTYVLYCEQSIQSALIAEKMQEQDFMAYSLRDSSCSY